MRNVEPSRVNFINILQAASTPPDPKNAKKDSQIVSLFLSFQDLGTQKLLVECWWNWPLVSNLKFQKRIEQGLNSYVVLCHLSNLNTNLQHIFCYK